MAFYKGSTMIAGLGSTPTPTPTPTPTTTTTTTLTLADVYPVGSIYISLSADLPPSFGQNMSWERIASGKCLWGAGADGSDTNTTKDAGLPNMSATTTITSGSVSFTGNTNANGDHSHVIHADMTVSAATGTTGVGSFWSGTELGHTASAGSHSHTFSGTATFSPTATTTISTGLPTASTVQPPALVVSMWRRVS